MRQTFDVLECERCKIRRVKSCIANRSKDGHIKIYKSSTTSLGFLNLN